MSYVGYLEYGTSRMAHFDPGRETHREARLVNALDALNLRRLDENTFGEKKSADEVVVIPRSSHHYRKRGFTEANLEGFLHRNRITFPGRRTRSVSSDLDVTARGGFTR